MITGIQVRRHPLRCPRPLEGSRRRPKDLKRLGERSGRLESGPGPGRRSCVLPDGSSLGGLEEASLVGNDPADGRRWSGLASTSTRCAADQEVRSDGIYVGDPRLCCPGIADASGPALEQAGQHLAQYVVRSVHQDPRVGPVLQRRAEHCPLDMRLAEGTHMVALTVRPAQGRAVIRVGVLRSLPSLGAVIGARVRSAAGDSGSMCRGALPTHTREDPASCALAL